MMKPRKRIPSSSGYLRPSENNDRPTGPIVPLGKDPAAMPYLGHPGNNPGDLGFVDLDQLQVAEHDERGKGAYDGHLIKSIADAVREWRPSSSTRLATGQMNLQAAPGQAINTVGIALVPAKVEENDGQLEIVLWKNTQADVIFIGNGPNQCNTPLPSIPLRLLTGAVVYARLGSGADGTVCYAVIYR